MIIILTLVAISLLACGAVFRASVMQTKQDKDWDCSDTVTAVIVCFIIILVTTAVPLSKSYANYVKARVFYDSIHKQYHNAVIIYGDKAIIDTERALTDFKYQGYQENIARFIKDLRLKVAGYNTNILSKRVLKRNPFLSWYIIAPDPDMKPLSMLKPKGDR